MKSVVLGALLAALPAGSAPQQYNVGDTNYIFTIANPTTKDTAMFVCRVLTPSTNNKEAR